MDLPKAYEAGPVEGAWLERWRAAHLGVADPASGRPPFAMVIPPPNVTGALHMGHALNNTIQDVVARYERMRGRDVLWLPGTDHAGIATQNVVERALQKERLTRQALGREAFERRVWEWKETYGSTIIGQLRRLGASCDWTRERFTMDPGLSRAVREVFVRLHREGLLYRGERLVNWCPRCGTALADLEVEHEEIDGHLWRVRYPGVDFPGVVVATTRPETILGDTAVAVHPDDERWGGAVGRWVIVPRTGRRVRVIADAYVAREVGTGALKITPAHDPNDFEIGARHGLEVLNAFTPDGRIAAGFPYEGLDRFECRKRILADLEADGLLEGQEKHRHAVGHCYRCRSVVEPYLSPQWYVRARPLAEPAIEAVRDGRTRFVPEFWAKTYFHWLENVKDWCISRQIWWGHRIPAWWGPGGEVFVGDERDAPPSWRRDDDVLDTWFSSALWPFSTLGWPDETPELRRYYPTSLLVTGFDILFFWVARMMMMGLHFMGDVPFREVYVHGLIRDAEGKKMSKTKGNVVDPLTVMDEFGTDAFRFTLAAHAAQGRDIKLNPARIEECKHFANKVWNAARLVALHRAAADGRRSDHVVDRWIVSRLGAAAAEVSLRFEAREFDKAARTAYDFVWGEFCSWYLEMAKPRFETPEAASTAAAVLEAILRILHPVMPFVTEEIAERLALGRGLVALRPFPRAEDFPRDAAAEAEVGRLQDVVRAIRRIRAEFEIPKSAEIAVTIVAADGEIGRHADVLALLAKARPVDVRPGRPDVRRAAVEVVGETEVVVPLEGLIDPAAVAARLAGEAERAEAYADATERKWTGDAAARAPADVVEEARAKVREARERAARLRAHVARLAS